MKTPSGLRQAFLTRFGNKKPTREEIENFLEPYFDYDPEVAYKQALARATRTFVASFKDDRQVRECFGFETEGGQAAFAFVGDLVKPDDLPTLHAIAKRLDKQIEGCKRSKEKIEARIFMVKHQLTIHDFMDQGERKTAH